MLSSFTQCPPSPLHLSVLPLGPFCSCEFMISGLKWRFLLLQNQGIQWFVVKHRKLNNLVRFFHMKPMGMNILVVWFLSCVTFIDRVFLQGKWHFKFRKASWVIIGSVTIWVWCWHLRVGSGWVICLHLDRPHTGKCELCLYSFPAWELGPCRSQLWNNWWIGNLLV